MVSVLIVCGTLRFVSGDLSQSPVTESDVVTENQSSTSGTQPAVHEASTDTPADIGVFVGDPSSATDGQKYALLKTRQIPVFPGNNWPHETRSGKKRHLNARHFEIHGSWLCYSHEPAGLFYKVCLFFADRDAVRRRNGSTAPVTFINKGCTRYSRLTGSEGYFDAHCNTNYHKDASLVAVDFIYAFEHPAKSIDQQLDKQVHQRVAENRKRLKPIVSTIVFAGRMGLPLEHCDPAFFSNVSVLLTVLATLPVTTCSAERSFSVLRLLKTYLRSRMGEERLTGLALMYVHSDLKIDLDDIINRFSQKNRRLEFQR